MGNRRADSRTFASVFLADEDHVVASSPPLLDQLTGAVGRAVVDDDDLFLELEPRDAVE